MTNAFEYVSEVLEIIQEDNETRDTFLQRVAFQIQNLPEAGWNELPVELQDWYNKTADMLADTDNEVEFMDIPGSVKEVKKSVVKKEKLKIKKQPPSKVIETVEDEESEESENEESETVEEKPEPKKRGRKPSSEPKLPKAPKAPKEPKGPIAANAVREILCEDMNTTLDQLMTKLEERSVVMQRSSAQVVHLNTIRAFEVAIELGVVLKDGEEVLKSV